MEENYETVGVEHKVEKFITDEKTTCQAFWISVIVFLWQMKKCGKVVMSSPCGDGVSDGEVFRMKLTSNYDLGALEFPQG